MAGLGDFSCANEHEPILYSLLDMWEQDNTADDPKTPGMLAKCIMENQGAKFNPLLRNGQCLSWEIYWLQDCDFDAAYKGETFDEALECDIPDGKVDECKKREYDRNCFIHESRGFTEQECNNRLQGVNRAAERINAAIKAVRKALVEDLATFLTSNAQTNCYEDTYGEIVGTMTNFTGADFQGTDLLPHIEMTAMQNCIEDYKIVNGTNFWELYRKSQLGACCEDNGRENTIGFYDMVWDIHLDKFLGRRSTFLFNPKMIGFINTHRYQNTTPVVQHNSGDSTIWGWSLNDPILQYRAVNPNGGSSLVPIVYDIEYKRKCCGRNNLGVFTYQHDFTVFFSGFRDLAPGGCKEGETQILEFVNLG